VASSCELWDVWMLMNNLPTIVVRNTKELHKADILPLLNTVMHQPKGLCQCFGCNGLVQVTWVSLQGFWHVISRLPLGRKPKDNLTQSETLQCR
jgi:hypothetical protein